MGRGGVGWNNFVSSLRSVIYPASSRFGVVIRRKDNNDKVFTRPVEEEAVALLRDEMIVLKASSNVGNWTAVSEKLRHI